MTSISERRTPSELAGLGQVELVELLDARLHWLSAWTIHHANHLRESRDGLKVGGHQASCASMSTIMAALYGTALGPNDKVAVKPHAGPLLHALHYLRGEQSRAQLEAFRSFKGAQSYPSRTKDIIAVDFSTGSVGLGVAITAFASLVQDYLFAHQLIGPTDMGRMIALMGDAELDEGNIYECLIEAYKHDIRNCWWIIDYNRQSLDATTADRMFRRFDDMFETCGWRVVTLKHGREQREAFVRPGGEKLREWIDTCPNIDFAALTYQGGEAWRKRLARDLAHDTDALRLLESFDDEALARVMTNLGGHCASTLIDAFGAAKDERPTLFIAYTIKGNGFPFQGHKDNHAGLMTVTQIEALRDRLGITPGDEWAPFGGLGSNAAEALSAFLKAVPLAARKTAAPACAIPVPSITAPSGGEDSTQMAFGKILLDLAKSNTALADRIVTTSPDVTVSTNLGPFVNQRGLFRRREMEDIFRLEKIPSTQKWAGHGAGQHIELGIAENNLFLILAALGLVAPMYGERLFPIGTIYDPFIARGLDALNYACYQDARFLLVATPSGVTLGPEGGAHQSINTPLIGMGQPSLAYYEPAFVDELAAIMEWAFEHMQEPDGSSVYLRLSTRKIQQPVRSGEAWRKDAVKGGYWLHPPKGTDAIVTMGAVAPEAAEAWARLVQDYPGLGLLAITSPEQLHAGLNTSRAARRQTANTHLSHAESLLAPLGCRGRLVTVLDGHPAALSWLGSVLGHQVHALGVDRFGQTGDLPDLYREYGIDADAIAAAAAALFGRPMSGR